MKLILAVLLAVPMSAQLVTYFVPGTKTLGPYRAIAITVCNGAGATQAQTAAELQREAAGQGIRLATNTQLLDAAKAKEKRSWQRNTLLAIEIASWVMSAATAGELVKIEERYKAAFPVVAGSLRFATTVIKSDPVEIPPTRPSVLHILAGSCEEITVYGTVRGE